jgi:hypothetical protein
MSRKSQAKQARRKKRQAARDASWIPEPAFEELVGADDTADAIGEAVAAIDEWLSSRGWGLDSESAENLVSWFYPPSAVESDDEEREPVTRIWITVVENDEEVVLEFGAALVGAGGDDETYVLDPETLAEGIAALEAYRPGLPRPEFV